MNAGYLLIFRQIFVLAMGSLTLRELVMRLDRIEKDEEVLIDVISCMDHPELNDTSLACRTVDVSETGMLVKAEIDIPVEARLALRLDLSSELYRLKGTVRWIRHEETNYIGLLLDENSLDILPWTRMFQLDF
jgi:hypothetical protein